MTKPWTWPSLLLATGAKVLLACVVCLAAWGALPALVGWHPTTVSSGSMLPRLEVGDVAVSRPLAGHVPPIGSILLFDDPDHPGRLRMHRFLRLDPDGRLVTKGDANADEDSTPVDLSAVRGIGTLRVPWIGLPVFWLRQGDLVPLGLTALGFVGLLALNAASRRRGFDEDEAAAEPETAVAGTDDQTDVHEDDHEDAPVEASLGPAGGVRG